MLQACANAITRWWWGVILVWVGLALGVRLLAPPWDQITFDGDLAYLPEHLPSFVGEKLLQDAFPADRAQSQIVLVVARENAALSRDQLDVAADIARRFKNYQGATSLARGERLAAEAERLKDEGSSDEARRVAARAQVAFEDAEAALDEAIELDVLLAQHHVERAADAAAKQRSAPPEPPRLAAAHWNRARLYARQKRTTEAERERAFAITLDPKLSDAPADSAQPAHAAELPLLDVWTWRDPIFGSKLKDKQNRARLVVLQLENEFMATDNIRVLERVEEELAPAKRWSERMAAAHAEPPSEKLAIGISGSAAVGGDMLRSAAKSIEHTELFTILIVVVILAVVYRAPLLVFVPLVTIFFSLQVAMGSVALLTQLSGVPGFAWWDLKVFTTTKIFIVVILFGAGTDFCLFLIARFKEELQRGREQAAACALALGAVSDALIASAMTTILGLGMMFFADFGKYTYSGPVIGWCLLITLAACLTLAPALLRACGSWLYWPLKIAPEEHAPARHGLWDQLWQKTARWIVAYPVPIIVGSVLILFPAAWHGWQSGDHVTYDFLSGLADACPSKAGTAILKRHFPVGESGPLTVLVNRPGAGFDNREGRKQIAALTEALYVPGVRSVRSVTDPLGDFAPGERKGLFNAKSHRSWLTSPHRRTAELFVSNAPAYAGDVVRLEVILDYDPFDERALGVLADVDARLKELKQPSDSFWRGASFAYAGATAGVRDLRDVTRSDNQRIQVLVVVAVFLVLLAVLRRPLVCLYMIASVLFSYYVTIGATEAFFAWSYGPDYPGLDWKVPLFLFVILVAVGEDYNVYLATRVYEEQKRLGLFSGLRHAIVRTGGIITSCGVIMAGTFVSMTAGVWGDFLPSWLPLASTLFPRDTGALRGIVELGFALTLGVLLDTFIVRPILVPAFMAILAQRAALSRVRTGRPRVRKLPAPHTHRSLEAAEAKRHR